MFFSKRRNLHNDIESDPFRFLQRHVLTAAGVGRIGFDKTAGVSFHLNEFSVKNNKSFVTLERPGSSSGSNLHGYWVPQGDSCVIPARPDRDRIVFTPDFTGCSIRVDKMKNGDFKVYHVQGGNGRLDKEYLSKNHEEGMVAKMDYSDYSVSETGRCFAFLHYQDEGGWRIYAQKQAGLGIGMYRDEVKVNGPFFTTGIMIIDFEEPKTPQ